MVCSFSNLTGKTISGRRLVCKLDPQAAVPRHTEIANTLCGVIRKQLGI